MRRFLLPCRWTVLVALLAAGFLVAAPTAGAKPDIKKSIWGPGHIGEFDHYSNLGVGIYQRDLSWHQVAPTKPAHPRDPNDPAYQWPSGLDTVVQRAKQRGIRVSMMVLYSPGWANGGQPKNWAPRNPSDYADFIKAASRKYRYVRYWEIWGEPSRRKSFSPMPIVRPPDEPTRKEKRKVERYARLLDAAYAAVKSVNRRDLVIGGNTITRGDFYTLAFIRAMRLPNGKPPRMDLYGHNPYSPRKPNLSKRPAVYGTADFCDLDTLSHWIDRNLGRTRKGRKIRIFVAEYNLISDHTNYLFPYYGSRQDQADYVRAALHLTRSFKRVYTMGWFTLYDQAPRPDGLEANYGLLGYQGAKKPAYYAYKNH